MCILFPERSLSQQFIFPKLILTDSLNQEEFGKIAGRLDLKERVKDSLELNAELRKLIFKLQGSGFLAASIDSTVYSGNSALIYLHSGETYRLARIKNGNVDEGFLTGTILRRKSSSMKYFNYEKIRKLQEIILTNCENNGFPFAEIRLDSISIDSGSISARLMLNKNKFVKIDSVLLKGPAIIAPVYIYNYIGIRPGDVYNESQVSKISARIRELPFVSEARPNLVSFSDRDTKIELFLQEKKASRFDGVLGLLPNESEPGKYRLTGEALIRLQNALKRGEIMELNWKQLPSSSQDLRLKAYYPFVLNTPFGIEGSLKIFRKDSTYIDVFKGLAVQYNFSGNNFMKAFLNDKESSLQSTTGLRNASVLPSYADISIVNYGLSFHFEKLDYRFNPRKGYRMEITAGTGNRKITRNSEINPVLYDSLRLITTQYNAELNIDYYYSPGGRHVINPGLSSGIIDNPEIFSNELLRFGGLKSLRGFDEESLFASALAIGKLEYRYILEENSFLFLFFNAAWYENISRNTSYNDIPYGFGAGINFETRIGIMSVNYALGKQFDNPILVRNGKIHFGIVNYF
ncbi:MAG: hypothetical protein DWQ44_10255 [Bacteroidetes bacterium]|nr:MAG: hypothetical protein DWQ33_10535 [Bacteroidota bacterium]REK06657.1 MAG: hypothetical protein DWQ39_04045 [Bacteroidota bacterium]REK33423.1 MAG: hypothetical protein DWQ44_10255 [Bacteroidota bacterium]REK49822.1 MAG: hypothetical protein DWQ48_06810 [Bacteroidota bacterium]